jgi:hypothetical protein
LSKPVRRRPAADSSERRPFSLLEKSVNHSFSLLWGVCVYTFLSASGWSADEHLWPWDEMRHEVVPRVESPFAARKLPFSFEEIAVYFATALEMQPQRMQGKCVVFTRSERDGSQGFHETVVVVVTGMENDVSVTLLANADYGMNYFREFIESNYFFPEESEYLYYLLHNAPGVEWREMKRFRVQLNVMETADWEIVGMTLSPRSLLDLQRESNFALPPGE